jgi:hypothetical protein
MVWPILISLSVTPGAFSAKARRPANIAAVAAPACNNLRRENMRFSPSISILRGRTTPS